MGIGVSTACFYPMETKQCVQNVIETGACCTEVFLQTSSEYNRSYCIELRKRFADAGIGIVSVHGFVANYEPFLFSDYPGRAQDALREFTKVAAAGKYLGAKYYTFHGNRKEYYTNDFDFKGFGMLMNRLAEIALSNGLLLAWENVSWCQSGSLTFLKNSLEYIDSKKIGFTLDLKQAIRSGYKFLEYVEIFKDRLVNVHISDYTQQESCLLPGNGNADFPFIFKSLEDFGYHGDYIIEVYNHAYKHYSEIAKSIEFLRKTKEKLEKWNKFE